MYPFTTNRSNHGDFGKRIPVTWSNCFWTTDVFESPRDPIIRELSLDDDSTNAPRNVSVHRNVCTLNMS
jgi:hypothetical protein